jgi:SAM-dependent methyltransferase
MSSTDPSVSVPTDPASPCLANSARALAVGASIRIVGVMTDAPVPTTPPAHHHGGEVDWDERYAEPLWSGRPNGVLVVEVDGLTPGRALDVGCGEGADAIWLASQGWQVTGIDISQVALDRAAAAAGAADVEVEWRCADLVATAPPTGFDLVSVHYPALLHTADDAAIHGLLGAVAPGGMLLLVGHAILDLEFARSHGFDPSEYVQPPDVVAHLTDDWLIVTNETRPRVDPTPEGAPHVYDVVVVARRVVGADPI